MFFCVTTQKNIFDKNSSHTIILELIKNRDDFEQYVRLSKIKNLKKLASNASILGLIKALKDSNLSVRRNAVEVLGKDWL